MANLSTAEAEGANRGFLAGHLGMAGVLASKDLLDLNINVMESHGVFTTS